jgi:hypothetical protein
MGRVDVLNDLLAAVGLDVDVFTGLRGPENPPGRVSVILSLRTPTDQRSDRSVETEVASLPLKLALFDGLRSCR